MKFSCAIFFFVLTIAAQFQHIRTTVSDELIQFKRTLDDASNALQDAEESPALNGNVELQRRRRKSIDDLLHNSELDLNLDLEREALELDDDTMHPLQERATKNDNKNNNDDLAKKSKVNDQLNELVRSSSRFQNLHRQLLNSFHTSNTNLNMDDMLQKSKANKELKSSSSSSPSANTDKAARVNKEKNANQDTNNYSFSNKNSPNKNANKAAGNSNKDNYNSNFNWKSNFDGKDNFNFNIDNDFGKGGSLSAPFSQSFSKFDSSDSFNSNANFNTGRKDNGLVPNILTKAFISCKPLSSNAGHSKTDNAYLEFTSNLQEPQPNKAASSAKSNLNTILLLEANNYRNALNAKNMPVEDNLEELNEKKVDPEMHRMMQKVVFPHFKLDFDSSMEDFVQKSKSDSTDEDEPISYEKTIENIHFPSIVNDQFDLGRNDLSHEADYKLSKIEQEQSEPRKGHTHRGERNDATPLLDDQLKVPWKRSSGFNPMDEIKLKTSTRLMAKGLGPSLPSYALYETQQELKLDDAVKKLENNFNIESENEHKQSDRHGSLVSPDILDWQERLKRLQDIEDRTYEKLIYDDSPEVSKGQNDAESKTDDVILRPSFSVLRKRRIDGQANEDTSDLLDQMNTRRVFKDPNEADQILSQNLDTNSPDDLPVMQLPELTSVDRDKLLTDILPGTEMKTLDIPTQEDLAPIEPASDIYDSEKLNEVEDAQIGDDSSTSAEDSLVADIYKRCGEQNNSEQKFPHDKNSDLQAETGIFKFKRDTSKDDSSNIPKRRVKRIDVPKEAGELKSKRELKENTSQVAEQQKSAESKNRDDQINDNKVPVQKVLRRRRRELTLTQTEVFNDDSSHVLNGSNRMRRQLGKDIRHRVKRAAQPEKDNDANPENQKTSGCEETRMKKQNADGRDNANKLIRSKVNEGNNTEHSLGKRAAHIGDDIEDNDIENQNIIDTALLWSNDGDSTPAERYAARSARRRGEAQMTFDDNNGDNRKLLNYARLLRGSENSMPALPATQRRESLKKLYENSNEDRKIREPQKLLADSRRESSRKLDDSNNDDKTFTNPEMLQADSRASELDTSAPQRRESPKKLDDSKNDDRKFKDTAMLLVDNRDGGPIDKFAGSMASQRIEPLTDAAVIAADRRAMNAARATNTRNAARNSGTTGEAQEDDYTDLLERLRRLSLRNRGREKDRELQDNFANSLGEFGNQKFDNLKQADQYVRSFDGVPADNLWYGSDPWEEDNNNNCPEQNDLSRCEENTNTNKNQANQQNNALTIKIENGAIKSIERQDEPNKDHGASVVNHETGNEDEEDDSKNENAALSWFGKGKSKSHSGKSDKVVDDGLVLKLNDQLLNCTAFNTLEGFLKSVEQQQGRNDSSRSPSGESGNAISKSMIGNCVGKGDNKGGGQGSAKQGTNGHGNGGHERVGSGGDGQKTDGHAGGHRDYERFGSNEKKTGAGSGSGGSGDSSGGGGGSANGFGSTGSTSSDATLHPQGSCGPKSMKLNITINASVMGDQKANNFFGNGTIKVQSEERERRGISFPQFAQIKRYAMKGKCPKPKTRCDDGSLSGKGAMDIVKSVFNMAKCNPQMKPLWGSLKHNQQCLKKAPPQETGFEKMQKDDINHIEDMVEQAMEAISDIIDDQVEQRSCIPLPPELKLFYEQILDVFQSNSAEGVREKRANYDTPFDEFSKVVRLIDPNAIEERSRIVKKLLRQYDDLPAEEQQQMVDVRDDLLHTLGFLESIKDEQPQKKREQALEQQQPAEEPAQQPMQPEVHLPDKIEDSETDMQSRWRRELLNKLEGEKDIDQQLLKAYNLSYTPEYLRLVKASELMRDQEIRASEQNEENG